MPKTEQGFHYYGSTCYGWVVGQTKEYVLRGLANDVGSTIIKRAKERNGHGIEAIVCKVPLPQAAHYRISDYLPSTITKEDGINETRKGERIELEEIEHLYICNLKGKAVTRNISED